MPVLRTRTFLTAGASVALAAAGLVIPAVSAAAAPTVTVTPTSPTAGNSFTVAASGLTAGSNYRLVLVTDGANGRVDVSESNACKTDVAAGTDGKLSCAVTEATQGTYYANLLAADGSLQHSEKVDVSSQITTMTTPKLSDVAGTANDKVTLYKNAGIESYTVQGSSPYTLAANETFKDVPITSGSGATTDVEVIATAAKGFVFSDGSTTMKWILRSTSADPVTAALAPTDPVKSDPVGKSNDTLTFTKTDGVTWKIGNDPVTFGTGNDTVSVPVSATRGTDGKLTVTVTATAAADKRFADGATVKTYTYEFTDVKGEPSIVRTAGTTRFDTSVEIAKKFFPGERASVFVANGMNFPDALAAGPAAAQAKAPLILTAHTSIQQNALDEIARMKPKTITVVGGPTVVSKEVEAKLAGIAPVVRLQGENRFATAAKVSSTRKETGGVVYLASGLTFPDALSGGSGAAKENAPLLLTDGKTLTDETVVEMRRLAPKKVVIVGGDRAVSTAVQRQVGDALPGVQVDRAAGGNRFETSALIIEHATGLAADDGTKPSQAFLATGLNYPDALAGIPAAFVSNAPLALTMPTCLPPAVKDRLDALPLTSTVRLGSANIVGDFSVMTGVCS